MKREPLRAEGTVHGWVVYGSDDELMAENMTEETARLLVAAPDLLDALRALVNLSAHPYFREQADLPAWAERVQEASAAVEKAKGGR